MKKSLLLLIITIFTLTTAFDANAEWTDRNTFGLKGPVKEVYGPGEYESRSFDEDGSYSFDVEDLYIHRDNSGKLAALEIGAMAGEYYRYNTKGQVCEYKCVEETVTVETTTYTYNAKGHIIKSISKISPIYGKKSTSITTYTYQKFDKYGNWTKRTAKTGKKSKIETRTITYY